MNKTILFLVFGFIISLNSFCNGVLEHKYVEHHSEWIQFFEIQNGQEVLYSNTALRNNISLIDINPYDLENKIYWINSENKAMRSYEDSLKNVSNENWINRYVFNQGIIHIQIDINGKYSNNQWRKDHYLYFITSHGDVFAINKNTQQPDLFLSNPDLMLAKNINIDFENEEWPIMYFNSLERKIMRISKYTENYQVFLNINIDNKFNVIFNNNEIYLEYNGVISRLNQNTGELEEFLTIQNSEKIVFYEFLPNGNLLIGRLVLMQD